MITLEQAASLSGLTMAGNDGERIGKIGGVFLDDETGQPEWATVNTGLLGTKESFVPLAEAQLTGDSLRVPYAKDAVRRAPAVDADQSLSQQEEAELYAHYGLGYTERTSDSGLPAGGAPAAAQTAAPAAATGTTSAATARGTARTDDTVAVDRREEHLRVGVQQVETGRARLRKFVVTEQQTAQVAVAHDELRIEREPITAEDMPAATSGVQIGEAEHEVVLTAQHAVVDKEAVPVERIRVAKETVTDTQQVGAEVRKEEVELIRPDGTREDVDSDPTA